MKRERRDMGEGRTKDSAKVQIGAELLCKSAKVNLGVGVGTGVGVGKYFQVSGLGNRVPGSGVQVLVQVQDLNFAPHPHLYLITRTRDLRAETSDPKMSLMFVSLQLGQHAVLTLPVQGILFSVGEKTVRFEAKRAAERGDESDVGA